MDIIVCPVYFSTFSVLAIRSKNTQGIQHGRPFISTKIRATIALYATISAIHKNRAERP